MHAKATEKDCSENIERNSGVYFEAQRPAGIGTIFVLAFLLLDLPPFSLQGESSPVIRRLPSSGSPHSHLSRLQCCCRPPPANQQALIKSFHNFRSGAVIDRP